MTTKALSKTLALMLISVCLPAQVFAQGKIRIGDNRISSSPKAGYVFSCQQRFNPNAGGAHASGDWIKGKYWYPNLKPEVDGNVKWSGGGAVIKVNGNIRTITSKNLPSHTSGVYPISRSDDAYQYDRNPNSIRAQSVRLKLNANPKIASSARCVPMGMIGISLTGAAIFNAVDARGKDAPAHEIQDKCQGHPERSGQYHYHGPSDCMKESGKSSNGHSGLVGYALDGFGIFGLKGAGGKQLSNASLDACHGHTETVVWDGKVKKMYHYHLTAEYPYTLGCFKGTPVKTDSARNLRSIGRGDPLVAAARKLGVSVNQLRRAVGAPPPNFKRASRVLNISEAKIRRAMRQARRQSN